jgi:hypothetical protein
MTSGAHAPLLASTIAGAGTDSHSVHATTEETELASRNNPVGCPTAMERVQTPTKNGELLQEAELSDSSMKERKTASNQLLPSARSTTKGITGTEESQTKPQRQRDRKVSCKDTSVANKKPRRSKNVAEKESAKAKDAPPTLNEYGMYYGSFEEASQNLKGLNWPPRIDETLPASPADRRVIVKEPHAAMNDMSDFQDKLGPVFKKRWLNEQSGPDHDGGDNDNADSVQGLLTDIDSFYEPWRKEKMCWEILVSRANKLRSLSS